MFFLELLTNKFKLTPSKALNKLITTIYIVKNTKLEKSVTKYIDKIRLVVKVVSFIVEFNIVIYI